MGVDDGRHRIGGVVEAVDELESQRDEQRNSEQDEGIGPRIADHGQIVRQVDSRVYDARDDDHTREDIEPRTRPLSNEG